MFSWLSTSAYLFDIDKKVRHFLPGSLLHTKKPEVYDVLEIYTILKLISAPWQDQIEKRITLGKKANSTTTYFSNSRHFNHLNACLHEFMNITHMPDTQRQERTLWFMGWLTPGCLLSCECWEYNLSSHARGASVL